jgi:hypothetical protein
VPRAKVKPTTTRLRDHTQHMLRNRNVQLTYVRIAQETGLNVRWLEKFALDKFTNPGVNSIECLYEYLTKQPLNI